MHLIHTFYEYEYDISKQYDIVAPGFTGSFTFMCHFQLKLNIFFGTFIPTENLGILNTSRKWHNLPEL